MRKEKTIILLLACINFTHIMDFMIMMPLGPQLMRLFKIQPAAFSFLVSAYTFSAGISGFFSAFVVDRFDRKTVLLFGYIGFTLGTLACALAQQYETLVAARILAGLFGGLIGAQVLSIIADLVPFERRGAAMGTLSTAFSAASVFGVPFGLYAATQWSWQAPFYIIAGLGFFIIPAVYSFLPPVREHLTNRGEAAPPKPMQIIRQVVQDRNQRMGLLFASGMIAGHFCIIPFISPYMVSNVGFLESELPYIYILGGGLIIFTAPYVGKMADQYGKLKVLNWFVLLSAIPVLIITNLPRIPFYYVLLITTLFFVITNGRMIPSQAIISSVVLPQYRGSFMSINSSLQQLATGLAAYVGGLIIQKNEQGELLHYGYVGILGLSISFACLWVAAQLKAVDAQPAIKT